MDGLLISTLSCELKKSTGDTSNRPITISSHDLSLDNTQPTSREMPSQNVPSSTSQAEISRRIFKEPRFRHSEQIPFRQPSGYVAKVGQCVDQRKNGCLIVQIPSVADTDIRQKAGSASKFRRAATSEILELNFSQTPSPEPVQNVVLDIPYDAAEDASSPALTHLPTETQFHFNDSLPVEDLSATSPSEQKPPLMDDPSIPITYDKVWDPFAPSSKIQGAEDIANLQSYPSPAPTARSMSFSLPSNYTELNIHHAPPSLPITSVASDKDPPLPAWKMASQSIVEAPKGRELALLEDCLSEDIAIRAAIDGWDSMGERWELPPFWRVIRVMDELIFGKFNPVVRLASLIVVHLLMRYHSDPSPERAKNMPKFYNLK